MRNKSSSKSIYYDTFQVVDRYYPQLVFFFFQGGRGKGKTYSTLKGMLERIDERNKMFYVRRTDEQIKLSCTPFSNPFKAINNDTGRKIEMKQLRKTTIITDEEDEDNPVLLGYGGSLSTFGNLRGADYSDVSMIFFDEWINLSGVNTMKHESNLLFNLYETIARNREFEGKKPPLLILCSNSESLNDDIIRALKLGKEIMELSEKGYGTYIDKKRGIYYELLENDGEFEKKKSQTALYKLTEGTSFYDMALDNQFTKDFFGDIKRYKMNEFNPICAFENVYFYMHKTHGWLYATYRKAKCPKYYERTLKQFKRDYGFLMMKQIEGGLMKYMDYNVKIDVMNIF